MARLAEGPADIRLSIPSGAPVAPHHHLASRAAKAATHRAVADARHAATRFVCRVTDLLALDAATRLLPSSDPCAGRPRFANRSLDRVLAPEQGCRHRHRRDHRLDPHDSRDGLTDLFGLAREELYRTP